MPSDNTAEPTPQQIAGAERVHRAFIDEVRMLAAEGLGFHEIISGMGAAMADVISMAVGPDQIAPWFDRYAKAARQTQG